MAQQEQDKQTLAIKLEHAQEEAAVLAGKLKAREQQLHQELLDKEVLVKQMDGYEQSIGLLKAKLAEQNMV